MNTTTTTEKKVKKGVALAGVNAGTTAVCTVGHTGNDLHYRGYDILDLAKYSNFEEVAYLLIYGELPTQSQLSEYKNKLRQLRDLPEAVKSCLRTNPKKCSPYGRPSHRLLYAWNN